MAVKVAEVSQSFAGTESESRTEAGLRVAVVRLLAVALSISGGHSPLQQGVALPIPDGYRDWPSLTSRVKSGARWQRLRLYVCRKALRTADHESFPIGTTFVVESEPWPFSGGVREAVGSLFVMEKCAGLQGGGMPGRDGESWVYVNYMSDGRPAAADSTRCGVCRVPLMPSAADP